MSVSKMLVSLFVIVFNFSSHKYADSSIVLCISFVVLVFEIFNQVEPVKLILASSAGVIPQHYQSVMSGLKYHLSLLCWLYPTYISESCNDMLVQIRALLLWQFSRLSYFESRVVLQNFNHFTNFIYFLPKV